MKEFFLFIVVSVFISCDKKEAVTIKNKLIIKDKVFLWDSFIMNDNGKISIDSFPINITNDTVYLFDISSYCNEIWAIGYLKNNDNQLMTLSNECDASTLIYHLFSETSQIEDAQGTKRKYKFHLRLGTNGAYDEEIKRSMLFSKNKGIISMVKNDTILMPPLW